MDDQNCENCVYLKPRFGRNFCLRFPQRVQKSLDDWCGEWTPDTPEVSPEPEAEIKFDKIDELDTSL